MEQNMPDELYGSALILVMQTAKVILEKAPNLTTENAFANKWYAYGGQARAAQSSPVRGRPEIVREHLRGQYYDLVENVVRWRKAQRNQTDGPALAKERGQQSTIPGLSKRELVALCAHCIQVAIGRWCDMNIAASV